MIIRNRRPGDGVHLARLLRLYELRSVGIVRLEGALGNLILAFVLNLPVGHAVGIVLYLPVRGKTHKIRRHDLVILDDDREPASAHVAVRGAFRSVRAVFRFIQIKGGRRFRRFRLFLLPAARQGHHGC